MMNVLEIFSIPEDILLFSVSPHLSQKEKYRLFALCKAWIPLLREVRTFTLRDQHIERFLTEESFRSKILNLVRSREGFVKKKLKLYLHVFSNNEELLLDLLSDFKHFILSFENLNPSRMTNYQVVRELYPHLAPPTNVVNIRLHFRHLHRLAELEINENNEAVNLCQLMLQWNSLPDDENDLEQNKELKQQLKGIKTIDIKCNCQCNIELCRGSIVEKMTLSNCNEVFNIKKLFGIENITLQSCPGITDISPLSETRTLALRSCNNIRNFSVIRKIRSIKLGSMQKLDNIMLSTLCSHNCLTELNVQNCNAITDISCMQHIPKLTIADCNGIEDFTMLDKVKFLKIAFYNSLSKRFPIPSGIDQEWKFLYVNIMDLTGYNKLRSLTIVYINSEVLKTPLDLSPLDGIHTFALHSCNHFTNIHRLANVKLLTINHCNIKDVSMLQNVEELDLENCNEVISVEGLHNIYGKGVPKQFMSKESMSMLGMVNEIYFVIHD